MKRTIEKKCAHCGEEFKATNPLQIYCCPRCNNRACYDRNYKKHGRTKKTCLVCGKQYVPNSNQQKYCGADCAKIAHRNQIQAWKEANAALVRVRSIKYSRDYRARRGNRYARKPLKQITCPQCGQVFMQSYPTQKYCSETCCRAYHHRAENRTKRKDNLAWLQTATQKQMDAFLKKLFG